MGTRGLHRGPPFGSPLPLLLAVSLASFAVFIWTMHWVEHSLNAQSESLFYPWRVRRHARRIDGVLATSIRRLASGEDEEEVLATLRLHVEGELRGEAGRWYDLAVDSLEEAAGRDWVFDAERRERALEEAERCPEVVGNDYMVLGTVDRADWARAWGIVMVS